MRVESANNYMIRVSDEDVKHVRDVLYFRTSEYNNLNNNGTLDFFHRLFVEPLASIFDISKIIAKSYMIPPRIPGANKVKQSVSE